MLDRSILCLPGVYSNDVEYTLVICLRDQPARGLEPRRGASNPTQPDAIAQLRLLLHDRNHAKEAHQATQATQ